MWQFGMWNIRSLLKLKASESQHSYLRHESAKRRCYQYTGAARHGHKWRHKCLKEGRRAVQVLGFKVDQSDADIQ